MTAGLAASYSATNPAALNEADSGQPMDDQTAIDVYERAKYSDDHREHRDGNGDAPKGSPIEHDATLTGRWERAVLFVAVEPSQTAVIGKTVTKENPQVTAQDAAKLVAAAERDLC
jgi:hypothetical protein